LKYNFSSEDKIQLLWELTEEYKQPNIMFDFQVPAERFVLPVILLRGTTYLPFEYKGMEVKVRHVG